MQPQLIKVPIAQLHAKHNVRQDLGDLRGLAASYQDGQPDQPPVVTRNGNGYDILLGHRRVAAAQQAGASTMWVLLRPSMPEVERITRQLVENRLRKALNPIEEARAIQALLDLGKSRQDLAAEHGFSEPYISLRLQLLELHQDVQQAVAREALTVSIAEELRRLPEKEQPRLLPAVLGKTTRQAKQLVDQELFQDQAQPQPTRRQRSLRDEFTIYLDNGNDPLFVLALSQLREAQGLVQEVYSGYRLSSSSGEMRAELQRTLRTIVEQAQAMLDCIQKGETNGTEAK